jgi:hypothetical protein
MSDLRYAAEGVLYCVTCWDNPQHILCDVHLNILRRALESMPPEPEACPICGNTMEVRVRSQLPDKSGWGPYRTEKCWHPRHKDPHHSQSPEDS